MPEVGKKATAQRHVSWAGKIMGGHQGQEGHKEKSFFFSFFVVYYVKVFIIIIKQKKWWVNGCFSYQSLYFQVNFFQKVKQ